MEISMGSASVGTVNNVETLNGGMHIYNGSVDDHSQQGDINVYNYLCEHPKEALARIVAQAENLSPEQVAVVAEVLQDSNSVELQKRGGELMAVKDNKDKAVSILKLIGDALKNVNEGFKVGENIAKYGPTLITLLGHFIA